MFCPKCGKKIPDNTKFCKYCGAEISKKPGTVNNTQVNNTKSSDNKVLIVLIVIAVIVLAAISIFAVTSGVFTGDAHSNTNTNNNGASSVNKFDESKSVATANAFPVSEAPALANKIANSGYSFPVTYGSLSLSKSQCLYILTKSIVQISAGNSGGSISIGNPSYCNNPYGRDYSTTISQSQYVDMSVRFSNWIENHGVVPNYIGINTAGVSDISPTKMVEICVKVLIDYGNTGSLPASVSI